MARKLLKDDPLDNDRPDLMQRAIQRGVGREAPDSESVGDNTITHTITQSREQTNIPTNTPTLDIEAMFATNPVFFTVRLPEAARDWVTEEAHKRRKQKVTQQSIVADALREYIEKRLEEN